MRNCYVSKDYRGWYSVGNYKDGPPPLGARVVFQSDRADECISYITEQLKREEVRYDWLSLAGYAAIAATALTIIVAVV